MTRFQRPANRKLDMLLSKIGVESEKSEKRHKDLSSEIKQMNSRIKNVEKRVDNVVSYTDFMNEEMKRLSITVNNLTQAQYKDELLIRGVPEGQKNDDELLSIVQMIIGAVNCVPVPTICVVRRLGKIKQNATQSRPILL